MYTIHKKNSNITALYFSLGFYFNKSSLRANVFSPSLNTRGQQFHINIFNKGLCVKRHFFSSFS